MSNPWATSFEEMRAPYLQEKKAKKDYDGDGKIESGSKEHAGVVHNAIQKAKGGKPDGKDTRKEEAVIEGKGLWANIHAKRKRGEKKAKPGDKDYPKTLNIESKDKYDNTKSPDHAKKKAALAKKHGGMDKIKGHPQYEHHGIDIEHLNGSVTEITDVVKAPKIVAAPKFSDWREDFIWDEPVEEALKNPKLELEGDGKKDVKNKIEINPTVASEGMGQARANVGASTCWDGYKAKGTKMKNGRKVPNCVKEDDQVEEGYMSKDKEDHNTGGFMISQREAKKAKERILAKTKAKREMKKEDVEQIDEIDNMGSKLAIGAVAGAVGGGLKLMQAAKNAAERMRKKREDKMKNLNMGEEAEKKTLDEGKPLIPNVKVLKKDVKDMSKPAGKAKIDYRTLAQSYEPEGEVVTELNRYEKETGKSSGSMNMPKGTPTSKGGTSSPLMRAVRTKFRQETGKPVGQKKKTKGVKGNPQPGDRKTTPATTIAKRRQIRADADKLMRDTSGT